MVLYYGCRKSDEDYIYGEALKQWVDDGIITELHTAFSREGLKKVS